MWCKWGANCAIHKHFVQNDHQLQDLQITLVEKVPGTRAKYSFLYMPAIRKRLEKRWIHRLKATLNVKRVFWFLFSGSAAARGDPKSIDQGGFPVTCRSCLKLLDDLWVQRAWLFLELLSVLLAALVLV